MDGIIGRVGQNRPDMPWTENKLDPELVELVKNYEEENKPVLYELYMLHTLFMTGIHLSAPAE